LAECLDYKCILACSFIFLLCAICALWDPSENCTRYTYSDDVGEEFNERDYYIFDKVINNS